MVGTRYIQTPEVLNKGADDAWAAGIAGLGMTSIACTDRECEALGKARRLVYSIGAEQRTPKLSSLP